MPDWYKSHEITANNTSGSDRTRVELWQYLDSAPLSVNTLAVNEVPEIESTFPQYGIGVLSDRVTLSLINNYNAIDLRTIFKTKEAGNVQLKIWINFGAGFRNVFTGFPEYNFDEGEKRSNAAHPFVFTVDFVSGYTLGQDTPINAEVGTDIIGLMPVYSSDYVFMYQFFHTIFKTICDWPDQVRYAATNLEAENWRYYTNAKGTTGVPDPNVIFREMKMKLHNGSSAYNDVTLGEMLQDLAEMFFCCIGYSSTYEAAMVHHYFQGQRNQSYKVLGITGTAQSITAEDDASPVLLDLSKISNQDENIDLSYHPVQAADIQREGIESLPEHPKSDYAKNTVISNPVLSDPLEKTFIAGNFYLDWLVQSQPDPSTAETAPGRLFDRDYFGSTSGLFDLVGLQVGYYANLLFRRRGGIKTTVHQWLDPMLPYRSSEDNTIHRLIKTRRNVITLTTTFESIEIGPVDNFTV